MELAIIIYLIETLPRIAFLFLAIGIIGSIFSAAALLASMEEGNQEHARISLKLFLGFFLVLLFGAAVPNKKTSYTMLAGYGVQYVAQMEQVQETASKSFQLIEQRIEEYLDKSSEAQDEE